MRDTKTTRARSAPLSTRALRVLDGLPVPLRGPLFPITQDSLEYFWRRALRIATLQNQTVDALTTGAPGDKAPLHLRAVEPWALGELTGLERSGVASGCVAACYDCLLSYSNQTDHRDIDRRSIAPYLTSLLSVSAEGPTGARRREEQYLRLLDRIDQGSSLERTFLDMLFQHGGDLPDYAQYCPTDDVPVQVVFY